MKGKQLFNRKDFELEHQFGKKNPVEEKYIYGNIRATLAKSVQNHARNLHDLVRFLQEMYSLQDFFKYLISCKLLVSTLEEKHCSCKILVVNLS